jgi:malonate transporter and related proteins
MIETVLNGLLPVAFTILLGWASGRLGYLKHEHADIFAVFVLRFALPLSLFLGAVRTPPERLDNIGYVLVLALGLMGTYFVALCVGLFVFRHSLRASTMQALVCAFPDMAYFGAPVLAAVIGPEGFLAVLVGNLITSVIMLPVTIVLTQACEKTEAGHGAGQIAHILGSSLKSAALNPLVWLPLLGVALSFAHVALPAFVAACVGMVAKAAGGISLFALGLMFCGEQLRINADVLVNIGLKNFLQPALMFAGVMLFGLTGSLAHQVIITGAVPTATAASMFALRNKIYTAEAAGTILLSTLLGIVTETLLIAAFN